MPAQSVWRVPSAWQLASAYGAAAVCSLHLCLQRLYVPPQAHPGIFAASDHSAPLHQCRSDLRSMPMPAVGMPARKWSTSLISTLSQCTLPMSNAFEQHAQLPSASASAHADAAPSLCDLMRAEQREVQVCSLCLACCRGAESLQTPHCCQLPRTAGCRLHGSGSLAGSPPARKQAGLCCASDSSLTPHARLQTAKD
jgi:hypothetical protein